jgi:hypothetical protein
MGHLDVDICSRVKKQSDGFRVLSIGCLYQWRVTVTRELVDIDSSTHQQLHSLALEQRVFGSAAGLHLLDLADDVLAEPVACVTGGEVAPTGS